MLLNVLLIGEDKEDLFLILEIVDQIDDINISLRWERDYDGGMDALDSDAIDVCLVDHRVGRASGVHLVAKATDAGCQVPMVVLTDKAELAVDRAALEAGAAYYLEKDGLTPSRLERTLRYAANRRSSDLHTRHLSVDLSGTRRHETRPEKGIRIALIEDDEDDYLLTRELLVDIYGGGLELQWVSSWEEGLRLIGDRHIDVFIVDYRLGERNGLELVREAVDLGASSPFIVLTGEADRETDLEAMHAGATDYLVKGEITAPLLDRSIRYAIDRAKAERRLADLAKFDQLTGVANRYLFNEFLTRSLGRAQRHGWQVALILIDLDRFKAINDNYGHSAGDLLLRTVARRLTTCVRATDLVARLGGDEFTIVLTHVDSNMDLAAKASQLSEILRYPIDIGPCRVEVGCSVGIAFFPDDAQSTDGLIVSADTAMYAAKQNGKGSFHFYTMEMRQLASRRLQLETGLRSALADGQFEVVYQPKADLANGRLVGFEALLRWLHPELGVISPKEFIRLAEESNLIQQIGEWVLRTACQQLRQWRGAGLPDVRMSVNFSGRQFLDDNIVERVALIVAEFGLPPHVLEIEITETHMLQHGAEVVRILERFCESGIDIALDDFGTGFSSLNHLRSFPGGIIKIDHSFVKNLRFTDKDAKIVRSLISMAHGLNLKVVAEGVERIEQLDLLRRYRCDIVQGFLVGLPLSADAISERVFHENLLPLTRAVAAELVDVA